MSSRTGRGARCLRHAGLAAALILAAVAAWPLLSAAGLVNTRAGGDSPFLLLRVYELRENLRAGVVPARWMPHAAYGLGYPFFNYYASLPYYLAAALSLAGAGVLWAIKLTQFVGFLAAAAAIYALANELLDDQAAAFLAAAAYTFAPFHMANVYVRGDSLSEFYAFAFYPLILWAILRLRRTPTAGGVALLSFSYAGLMVTHNISALIFSPLAGLALLGVVAAAPRARLHIFLLGAAGLCLGAAMGAWFWAPALLERSAASLTDMTTGYFHYSGHFRSANLVQRALAFDYTLDTTRTPFALGGLQAALAIGGLVVLAVATLLRRRHRALLLGLATLAAYAVWPITPSSAIAWAHVPLLPMVQFPWRFLSIAALPSALIPAAALSALLGCGPAAGRRSSPLSKAGERVAPLPEQREGAHSEGLAGSRRSAPAARPQQARALALTLSRTLLAVALSALIAYSAMALLRPETLPLAEADVTPERLQLYEHLTGNIGSTVRAEYLPQAAVPRPFTGAALITGEAHPAPVAAQGTLTASRLLSAGPTSQEWEVAVEGDRPLIIFQTYYFPGWQATVDGQAVPINADVANGRIALQLQPGRHQVALRLGRTPLRAGAEFASLAALAAGAGLVLAAIWRAQAWRALGLAGATVALIMAAGALLGALTAPAAAREGLATETMDYIRMPYLHPNPRGVAFGDAVRLVGYELSAEEVGVGDTIHVRLHWQAVGDSPAHAIVRLTNAAEPLFHVPGLAASEAQLATVTEHDLTVPPELAPGLALLAVEVRGSAGPLSPRTDQGAPLGTTYLAPVRVRPPAPAPSDAAIARLGEAPVDLLKASVAQPATDVLSVQLTWRPNAPLGHDYAIALRLLDAQGNVVPEAGMDVQLRYGMYPSSLWAPGVPVAEAYRLPLPRGTAPGTGYQLEVTLYDVRTLRKLGSLRVPGVTLAAPTIEPGAPVVRAFGGLALSRWQVEREEIADGEEAAARVQWTALAAGIPDATWRLALIDSAGREVAAGQGPIVPGYPSGRWPQHALVNGRVFAHLAPGTPAGEYRLVLDVQDASGRSLGRWQAPNPIRVRLAQRNTTLPGFIHPVGIDFGGLIRLPGYDLERTANQIAVTLHWQALKAPEASYKTFLHLFDPTTEKIFAQGDAFPLGGTYLTSQWAAGEVVSDRLVLDMAQVPRGHYQLAVGWYDPVTGERLEPTGDPARISNGRVLLQAIDW